MSIEPGTRVVITAADGQEYETEALSGPQAGRDFAVVWVNRPKADGTFDPCPWPVESVREIPPDALARTETP